jgi:Mg2+-importing ATPase
MLRLGSEIEISLHRDKINNSIINGVNGLYPGIAYKGVEEKKLYSKADESEMTLLGFLLFLDPPKSDVKQMISELSQLGVELKIITGDNRFISRYTAESVGFPIKGLLTGEELDNMSDEAMLHTVGNNNIFAEVDPNQKEKIILSYKKLGHVVGFIGDGINDATAIHASDVGISVNTAVDVAKEAADIVLLDKELETLRDGVVEGRKTFANTLKYVFMATSANFGNMFSVAGASLFLPFLPMLPKQILLTNLLTDFPEMTIATDEVDKELVEKPRKWDIKFIKRFMIFFGLMSSIFDYITFGVLLFVLKADATLFRTGWFVESVLSASFVVLIIRTRKPFWKSMPGKYLLLATLSIALITLVIPYLPFSSLLSFQFMPKSFLIALALILISYITLAEIGKNIFYRSEAKR